MSDMEPKHGSIIKSLANFIRQKKFKNGQYYEYRTLILKNKEGDVSFFREWLIPVADNEVWGEHEKERTERIKCHNSLMRDK